MIAVRWKRQFHQQSSEDAGSQSGPSNRGISGTGKNVLIFLMSLICCLSCGTVEISLVLGDCQWNANHK